MGPFEILASFKLQLHVAFFMEIVLISWCIYLIWMSRNDTSHGFLLQPLHGWPDLYLIILRVKDNWKLPTIQCLDHTL
jgi:hypothetical protein